MKFRKIDLNQVAELKNIKVFLKGYVTGNYYPMIMLYYSNASGVLLLDEFGNEKFHPPDKVYESANETKN